MAVKILGCLHLVGIFDGRFVLESEGQVCLVPPVAEQIPAAWECLQGLGELLELALYPVGRSSLVGGLWAS